MDRNYINTHKDRERRKGKPIGILHYLDRRLIIDVLNLNDDKPYRQRVRVTFSCH